jgi:hypothetical protein
VDTKLTIGVAVVIALGVMLAVKIYLQKWLSFKMDESAILKHFEEPEQKLQWLSSEEIAAGIDISITRVYSVCSKSKAIKRQSKDSDLWCSNSR